MITRQQPHTIYVWPSRGLWYAQTFDHGDPNPGEVQMSIDRYDAIEQARDDRDPEYTSLVEDRPGEPSAIEQIIHAT